jgi:murein L,D-transpeptidase YafK
MMTIKRLHVVLVVLALAVCVLPLRMHLRRPVVAVIRMMKSEKTINDRVALYGDAVRARLAPVFARAKVAYPPRRIMLVGLKAERTIEVWVSGEDGKWRYLRDYPVLGMSGGLGPKLQEGDMQVPEGLYRVESLNPNSLYHLALRVNYPNPQDQLWGKQDGRSGLGSDIMIHGKTCSIGCLAMGDEAAEDLFVLAAETGIDNVSIILAPVDFRTRNLPAQMPPLPPWSGELYKTIKKELATLGRPPGA